MGVYTGLSEEASDFGLKERKLFGSGRKSISAMNLGHYLHYLEGKRPLNPHSMPRTSKPAVQNVGYNANSPQDRNSAIHVGNDLLGTVSIAGIY